MIILCIIPSILQSMVLPNCNYLGLLLSGKLDILPIDNVIYIH